MKLFDAFLPQSFAEDIRNELLGPGFAWNYNPHTVAEGSPLSWRDKLTQDSAQFTHVMAYNGEQTSPYYNMVYPMIYFLEERYRIARLKANMLVRDASYPSTNYNVQHQDAGYPGPMSLLYYVTDSDGDTKFFDLEHSLNHTVTPRHNQAVLFDSRTWHASSPPQQASARVVLNFVLEPL